MGILAHWEVSLTIEHFCSIKQYFEWVYSITCLLIRQKEMYIIMWKRMIYILLVREDDEEDDHLWDFYLVKSIF